MVAYEQVKVLNQREWKGRINLQFQLKEIVRDIQEGTKRICKRIKGMVLKQERGKTICICFHV